MVTFENSLTHTDVFPYYYGFSYNINFLCNVRCTISLLHETIEANLFLLCNVCTSILHFIKIFLSAISIS